MADLITASVLRHDLAVIVAATFVASLGVAALALYALRRRSADIATLAFAAFALLYAIRLTVSTLTLRFVIGGEDAAWEYMEAALTYTILVPITWFAEGLLGRGWHDSLHRLRLAALVFAPIAIVGMFVALNPEWVMRTNNVLVLSLLGAMVLTVRARPVEPTAVLPVVRAGILIAVVFVVAENLRAIGVAPWPAGIEFIGVMIFMSALAVAVADRFLRTEGRLAAVERELATARRIQQAILPDRVPTLERFRIAVRYVPMTEVAGDFYDFLDVRGAHGTILVADVSGHGVPAALIASMVKVAAASHAEMANDPGRLMSALSLSLTGQLGGQFLTAMCIHLDGERGEVAYAGAGHPPALLWRASERRLELMPSTYAFDRTPVKPGDRLLLYTDGVLEALNSGGDFFGDERFHAVVAEHASRSGADLGAAVLDEMARWAEHRLGFEDDVTLVVVEVQ